jgi:AcrR family transcriptional regulator
MKRAHHPEQKETRRQLILEAAKGLLATHTFQTFRMADLAEQAGLAKGTLYLYFPTKESLFLALLGCRLETWFQRVETSLSRLTEAASPAPVAKALASPLVEDPSLPELLALLHGILEQNLPLEEVVAFKRSLLAQLTRLGPLLESRLAGLSPGRGTLVFLRLHALVIGVQAMASRPAVVAEALRLPDLAGFDLPFHPTLIAALTDLLAGMTRR